MPQRHRTGEKKQQLWRHPGTGLVATTAEEEKRKKNIAKVLAAIEEKKGKK
jgi:hypothetical protein